ncbi:MAG TPA: M24 family metallopeptidase [Chloroflexi bacterium]|jgi:Xaa-Pro aminopeptidase|nr:M24 family metallopeptidase [Chloroflexota bacterium]
MDTTSTARRLARLRAIMAAMELDAFVTSQPQNMRYLSGFTGGDGVVIVSAESAVLATDFRYYEQVEREAPAFALAKVTGAIPPVLASVLGDMRARKVGFEAHAVTVETFEQWMVAAPDATWALTTDLVEGLRQEKDAEELAAIEEAVRIADEAMVHLMEWIKPGVTERQAAWEAEVYMRTHGAEALSFTSIIASGEHGAMAHAVTTDRVIAPGDPLVIDMGCVYNGYCSDLTRSFCVGEASDEYLRIWNTVLEAQEAAEEAIYGGMPGVDADAVARKIIYDAGFEGKFGHGLGHGVGLAIHEKPRASMTSTDILTPGTIITVEPGIYIPGWCGVRTEDMVLVTEDGRRVLTTSPKRPTI